MTVLGSLQAGPGKQCMQDVIVTPLKVLGWVILLAVSLAATAGGLFARTSRSR